MSTEKIENPRNKSPRVIKSIKTVYSNMSDRLKREPELQDNVEFMGTLYRVRGLAQEVRRQEGQNV